MKKLLVSIILILSIFALVSCDGGADIPDGMQLVAGGEGEGYYFFAPEEWIISNVGNIKAAYISRVNLTSVSFAEVKLQDEKNNAEYFFGEYFNATLPELQSKEGFTLLKNGENASFGIGEYAADSAKRYVFSYKHGDFDFTFMQIIMQEGDRFFIFTYSAQSSGEEGVTPNYEKYLEKAQAVIENFRFTTKTGVSEAPEYTVDEDGYKLISDKRLSGFDLFVPRDFECDFSSAIVSATHPDGSSVNLTEATATGISATKYWETRKAELEKVFSEVTEIKRDEKTKLGNNSSSLYGDWAYAYEYTFLHEGEYYHVYQILAINGSNGYVFTYTAKEASYLAHFDEVLKIIEKVKF